ncbi:MAG TPA: NADP-dependent oxidoreductase [Streptosporangiaceae bacterium]|nr:NADP-dependent oxidoreductase [Streptosporangiaceae bacterium]
MDDSGMTRAVAATAFGGPEVLAVIQTPVGSPGPGEALVSVRAAGTNPIDYKLYSGAMGQDTARLPIRLGFEAAGVVTEVADAAEGPGGPVRVGDEVIAYRINGAYAADVTVPLSSVIPKPSPLSFEEASGMMLTGVTAVHALTVVAVGAGETVLIHGATGGVGLMAVQLAVDAGARVIGTASQGGHELLREFGAEPVLYGAGLEERVRALAPGGVDAAVDCAGGDEALDTSLALVACRGKIVTVVASRRAFDSGIKVIGGAPGADPGTEIRAAARLSLARLAEAGKLRVVVAAAYPLAETAAAHRALATGHTRGKIVLVP